VIFSGFLQLQAKERRVRHSVIDKELNITEELAGLMPMKGTTTGADFYEK
jgi:hypothetical protein